MAMAPIFYSDIKAQNGIEKRVIIIYRNDGNRLDSKGLNWLYFGAIESISICIRRNWIAEVSSFLLKSRHIYISYSLSVFRM